MVSNIYLVFVGLMWAGYVVAFRPSWKKSSIWFFDAVVLVVVRAATNRTFPVLEYPPRAEDAAGIRERRLRAPNNGDPGICRRVGGARFAHLVVRRKRR